MKKTAQEMSPQPVYSSVNILDDLLKRYTIGMLTLMIRRSAYDELDRGFDKRFSVMGDFDLVVRLAAKWRSTWIDEPIAHYRWHESNFSSTHPQKSCDELEEWYKDIKDHSVIGSSRALYNIPIIINYVRGMFYMRNRMKWKGLGFLLKIPLFRIEKLKIIVGFILPHALLNRLSR